MWRLIPIALFLATASVVCIPKPNFPETPHIEFVSQEKDTMSTTDFSVNPPVIDTMTLVISFEDGDGDIGDDSISTAFVTDQRTGFTSSYKIPVVEPGGTTRDISGEIFIEIQDTECQTIGPYEQSVFEIYIMDRAGNMSNVVTSGQITIRCL